MADATDDTDQIEHDLAQTRARMDRRLDELGDRLAPNQLVNDALAHVTGGDGADFTQTLLAKAKANPIPAVLAGVGIAWLLASSRRTSPADLPSRLRSAEEGVSRIQDEHADVHASRLDDARGQVLGIARTATDTAATYGQRIKDAIASASQGLRETSHNLTSSMSQSANQVGQAAGRGGDLRSMAGNPVILGAVTALVGVVAGTLIPVSNAEQQLLGGTAGRLREKGRDLAQDVVDRGAQVAQQTLGAVKDSAQSHGLTGERPVGELLADLKSGELLDQVKQAAQEIAESGKQSVKSQISGESDT